MATHGPGQRQTNSYGSAGLMRLGDDDFRVHRLSAVPGFESLPFSLKILLENLLRHEDGLNVTSEHIRWLVEPGKDAPNRAIQFSPSRVFLHDTNGVPVLTDLAALRDAVAAVGGDAGLINLHIPGELTVDHSVSTDASGSVEAPRINVELEYQRNSERYRFLKWGTGLDGFTVVPPGSGIMHQINLEYLARVVERRNGWAFPDTCAGTDSHTTMVNGLGVLAWGVGGIEAEAAMLGEPLTMLIPPVVGVELVGELSAGVTATDLVLTMAERLRAHDVVGKFVEFHGSGLSSIPLANRATIANMSPEYGSTSAIFPIDDITLAYLRFTGRSDDHVNAVETYSKEQRLWHDPSEPLSYDERVRVDLGEIEPSIAGPRRPHDRVALRNAQESFRSYVDLASPGDERSPESKGLSHGAVGIAAITSCTNTSNPQVMVGAGLFARNARRRGLWSKPWVKTSLAPGSKTVTEYLERSGLSTSLDELGFQLVGYGCMTCIGNSGPLLPEVEAAVAESGLLVASVLSGNRNFDGRINNDVAMNYLASPALVVAYALAGTMDFNLVTDPLGTDQRGDPVFFSELWPDDAEIDEVVQANLTPQMFQDSYASLYSGDERWTSLLTPTSELFQWDPESTYLRPPPFLAGVTAAVPSTEDVVGARVIQFLGDSVTTDHISPAGRIPVHSTAGRYLQDLGVPRKDLNSYASRRGNFEVMVRGGFTNPRLRNYLIEEGGGGLTRDFTDDGKIVSVHEAAQSYRAAGTPLLVLGGHEYGTGSSRDWAAKVTALLGVKVIIAQSYERIHRSNLVQLGVLPLQFLEDQNSSSLGLDGTEVFEIVGIDRMLDVPGSNIHVRAQPSDGRPRIDFQVLARVDTAQEAVYYRHGGILPFIYRKHIYNEGIGLEGATQ